MGGFQMQNYGKVGGMQRFRRESPNVETGHFELFLIFVYAEKSDSDVFDRRVDDGVDLVLDLSRELCYVEGDVGGG